MSASSEGQVEFSKVIEARVQEDGNEVWFVCQNKDGSVFDMFMSTDAIQSLIHEMNMVYTAARIKQENPPPVRLRIPRFVNAPPVLIARELSGVVLAETDQIHLEIQPVHGDAFVVGLVPELSKQLFDFLLQFSNLPGDAQPPQ